MGRDDELPVAARVKILDENLLVGRPRRAGHKYLGRRCAHESLYQRQLPAGLLDLQHAVEPGVAGDRNIVETDGMKQRAALLVLHKEMGEAAQHLGIAPGIPLEEHLIGAENARDTIRGHSPMLQDVKVVVPKLIFDEERHLRPHDAQEATCVADRVQGKIADDVGSLVVFPHLIARWREKREQELVFRMFPTNALHERTPLLELAKRGRMKPYVPCAGFHLLVQDTESVVLATPHLPHFFAEQGGHPHPERVKVDYNLIHVRSVTMVLYSSIIVKRRIYCAGESTSTAFFKRARVSALPRNALMSNMPGPLPIPTKARRKAFITSPSL